MKSLRRLCIRNSMLLGLREIQDSVDALSTTRSLLCVGPQHQYHVPICLATKLLRVLDALPIRLYEFPIEATKLYGLRYLALTCNGDLPCTISKLLNIRFLIVSQHLSIKSSEDSSYLPMEIWDTKRLEHLHVMGRDLPNPNDTALLPNLSTFLDVGVGTITKSVLERTPNLKRLGIRIELAPDENIADSLHCLNHISCLEKLESLKCEVVNPELELEVAPRPAPRTMFPSVLKKLSLRGLGYPWEYMKIIGRLPNLEVLKLKCYTFRGAEWETDPYSFNELKFLLIEDSDLVWWKNNQPCFMKLECVRIKHCYEIRQYPIFCSLNLKVVEVVDCYSDDLSRLMENGFRRPTGMADMRKFSSQSSWDPRRNFIV